MNSKISIYIHWPFCKSKCPYCDFNSHVRENISIEDWKKAYLKQIDFNKDILMGRKIVSIFFGGGTPSLMPSEIFYEIINKIASYATLDNSTEITFEANPTSVEINKFREFSEAGANRVSIGVQSLNKNHLKFLGREHTDNEALEAIEIARKYFLRYSFDLIYALPEQTLDMWKQELGEALKYVDKHISLYQLTIEKGTQFYGAWKKKKFNMPDEDLSRSFYQLTQDIMNEAGLPSYEISNHAALNEECKHNMAYWQYDEFLGIGPGAHSRVNSQAITDIYNPEKWLECAINEKSTSMNIIDLTKQEILEEFLIMGLRLSSGVKREQMRIKTGFDFDDLNAVKLSRLVKDKYLKNDNNCIRATDQGRLVLNHLISELIPA